MEEWCTAQLAKLEIKECRLDTLNEIRVHLKNAAPDSSKFLALLDSIDDCGDSAEQLQLTCDILCICMSNLEIRKSEWCYFSYLERCFAHPNNDIKILALNDIERRVNDHLKNNPPATLTQLYRLETLLGMISCIQNGDTKVAMVATRILLQLLPTSIENAPIDSLLKSILEKKDLIRCRIYELGVKLSVISQESHNRYRFILDRLINDLDTEDILLQVTALDFTSNVATTEHGYVYLENKDVFEKILQQIRRLDENPFKSMLAPGYLKFFGCIAAVQPAKIIRGFPEMIHTLFDCLMEGVPSTLPVAYDTLGQVAHSFDGKLLLDELYSPMLLKTFEEIGRTIPNLPTPMKIHALNSLEIVFQCEANDAQNNQLASITERWFSGLSPSGDLEFIHNFCKNPFPDIKLAALTLLRSVNRYQWGQMALTRTAGLIEYLLDRKAEFDKDVLHAKFEVLKDLSASTVFDATLAEQIRQYLSAGAFYVQGIMEVAVEGN